MRSVGSSMLLIMSTSKMRHEGIGQEAEGQRKKTEGFAKRGGFHEME